MRGGGGEIFTLIKPNEDFLAWHDGTGRKMTGDFIWNWHLNRYGSYSVSYIVQSLAITKWLKQCAGAVILAGLSQGGAAVMLNAFQSHPHAAIVASGASLITSDAEWSGDSQIIAVPGYAELYEEDNLFLALERTPTQWFFSWGLRERGTYKIEAVEGKTAQAIDGLTNVEVVTHEEGHVFPVEDIKDWLGGVAISQ
jgi:hypothetical protein